ncbi:MAG: hypothetical protein Fur0037_12200 [Planctomycetota bacterium]
MARRRTEEAPAAEVEVVETGGLAIDEGIAIATFVALIGAITLVYLALQHYPPLQ